MKKIHMLRGLLLKELTVFTLGDDFYRVILDCRLVEFMHECFSNDRAS
jgi:hypothetical protein